MRLVAVTSHPTGRRLHVLERRVHHGDAGALAVAFGLLWMLRDLKDKSEWFHFRRELP